MDGSFWNLEGMSGMAQTTSDSILGVIQQESWILDHFEIFVSMGLKGNRRCRYGAGIWWTTWRWIKVFLGHIELGQCRKCNYSLKRTQNFRLFNFVGQAVSEQHGLDGGLRAMTAL